MAALSGFIEMTIESYWKLRLEWYATQDYATNTSKVRADLYWMATRSDRGRITDTSEEFAEIEINGNYTPSYIRTNAALNDGQKKLILSMTEDVVHDADGTAAFRMGATFDVDTYLRGSYYSSMSMIEDVELTPIPGKSTLSVSADWTAGFQKSLTVKRQSVGYFHRVTFLAQRTDLVYEPILTFDIPTEATSATTAFDEAQIEAQFRILNKRATAPSRIILETWSGDNQIDSVTTDGTLTAPLASFLDAPTSFVVGANIAVEAKWYQRDFTHTISLKNGTTVLKSYADVDAFLTITTSDITAALNALMPTATTKALTLEVVTFYGAQQVRSAVPKAITAVAGNGGPTFLGSPTYADITSATVAITGNNQYIIQNKSNVRVTLAAANRALPNAGSTVKEYVATLGGKTITKPWSETAAVIFDFGTVAAASNQTLTIRAVDTRGRSTITTKLVFVLAYANPGISTLATRLSGYQPDTRVTLNGTVSSLKVANVEKNSIVSARVRSKEAAGTVWSGWTSFNLAGFPTFTATDQILQLNNLVAFHLEIEVTDKLGTTTALRSITSGKPLMMVDELLKSIGVGDFPSTPNTFLMGMRLVFGANKFASTASQGETGGGAMYMNNSDITGINGLWFSDWTSNTGEGLLYLKSGRPFASTNVADYNHVAVRDGVLFIDNDPVGMMGASYDFLWEGGSYLGESTQGTHTVTPSRKMSDCPNGWILIWSEYTVGTGPKNSGWQFTYIPKRFGVLSTGGVWMPLAGAGGRPIAKYIYISDTTLTGHPRNDDDPQSDVVLRVVLPF